MTRQVGVNYMANIDRFIRYAKIDTQSDDTTGTTPSTEKQKNLGRLLVEELKELGLKDAYMNEYGIVYAHLKGEGEEKRGFNAHMDTALEVTGENVNPQIRRKYDGGDIILNEKYTLSPKQFPSLNKHIGHDLVTTDGNTLLGADDKAGIAIIMSALEYLHNHPEVKHHNLSIAFTVDEEIGEGAKHFNIKEMDADYAFTVDGGEIECVDYDNFNAQAVTLKIQGVSVHPGEGKNALINALLLLNEFIDRLPKNETPFDSEYDQGYWHLTYVNGTSESVEAEMILREFEKEKIEKRDEYIKTVIHELEKKYPKAKFELQIKEQYENMRPYVDKFPRPVEVAKEALKKNGINPISSKIRGGTDGATFSKMGLVTPNLGTGSYNHHGRFEYLDIDEFETMIKVVLDIMKI